jgi:hypothetical protein
MWLKTNKTKDIIELKSVLIYLALQQIKRVQILNKKINDKHAFTNDKNLLWNFTSRKRHFIY